MTSPTLSTPASASEAALRPTTTGRRVAAWLVDLAIVAALVGVVYLSGLIRIRGCDTFDPDAGTFGASCPFEQIREVEREDGSIEVVYVLGSGRELPVDHPTVKTVVLGTRVVDPPGAATYLVGLGYVLAVFVLLQGLTGWTPGKLVSGIRLVRDDGGIAGVPPAFLRWLVVDGAIGLFGVLMGLVDGPWPLRLLAIDAAVGLLGGVAVLLTGPQGHPGDQLARTQVVDDDEAARFRRVRSQAPSSERMAPAPLAAAAPTAAGDAPPVSESVPASPSQPNRTAPIPLGPVGAPEGRAAEPAAADTTGAKPAGAVSSSIPTPPERPEPGARPRWAWTPSGAAEGAAAEAGGPDSPEYQTTPPLWGPVEPAASTPAPSPAAAAFPAEAGSQGQAGAGPQAETAGGAELHEPGAEAAPAAWAEEAEEAEAAAEASPEGQPEDASGAERGEVTGPVPAQEAAAEPAERPAEPLSATAAARQQVPFWDEARRAYIFWDGRRQEWLEFDYDNQRWGPISRA